MFHRKGGKPINSGGYGCIFKPALRCKGKTKREGGISKLMTREHADSEYDIIARFFEKIRQIPNYNNYFLIDDISVCEPSKLTNADLQNYNKICSSLAKKDFTKNNINTKLAELSILNLPDAGVDLDNYILENPFTVDLISNINTHLVQLLVNAIEPMNKLNILHMDMKGSNIMVSEEGNAFKIIDWGLADIYDGNYVPIVSTNRPIQYNTPFSAILFNDTFKTIYTELLSNSPDILNGTEENDQKLDTFIINYYYYWVSQRGYGHHSYIQTIFKYLIINRFNQYVTSEDLTDLVQYYFFTYMVSYIARVLKKYTESDKFQDDLYFKEVYSKNVDVWGLLISYEIMLPQIYGPKSSLTDTQKAETYKFITDLIMDFLYDTPTEPISIEKVTRYIMDFNQTLTGKAYSPLPKIETAVTSATKVTTRPSTDSTTKSVTIKPLSIQLPPAPITVVKKTSKRKRCPRGTHWNKKTQTCVSKYKKSDTRKQIYKVFGTMSDDTPIPLIQEKKRKRCPSGTRRNKRTGKCELKTVPKLPSNMESNILLKKENLPHSVRQLFVK